MRDLYDVAPIVVHGRYAPGAEDRTGTLTVRGTTGLGAYERVIPVTLPAVAPKHDVLPSLWARAQVGAITAVGGPKEEIIALGTRYGLLTEHTSFVAVERIRVTVDGTSPPGPGADRDALGPVVGRHVRPAGPRSPRRHGHPRRASWPSR